MARVLPTRRIRAAHHRTAVGIVMVLVGVLAPALAASPAAAQGCMIDGTTYKILGGGDKIWIGTSVYSNWKPGPASISRSESKTGTTSSSHGSSDTVSGGVNWGVVSAQYNHEWNRSTTASTSLEKTWTYETQIPAGMTARARVFKRGWSFPARKKVSYRRSATCPRSGDSWDFRARVPVASNKNDFFCDARDKWPGSDIIPHEKCTNV